MKTKIQMQKCLLRPVQDFPRDTRGLAAIEFVLLLPILLILFFGMVEVSTGVAVDRKVTLVTRTISDLISQDPKACDTDIANAFTAGNLVMTPYSTTPMKAKITQIYVTNSNTGTNTGAAQVIWSKAQNDTPHSTSETITIPKGIAVQGRYLIMSEVSYAFTPAIDFDSKLSFTPPTFNLTDQTFTRPRQSDSVTYTAGTAASSCSS
jgi:Flp pilus assembly protein TadG